MCRQGSEQRVVCAVVERCCIATRDDLTNGYSPMICFMYHWLSQNRYSLSNRPLLQCAIVAIGSLNFSPVGWMILPSGVTMGLVKVPVISPITAVHSPLPNLTGWTLMAVSG